MTTIACDIKDKSLADIGLERMEWALHEMPVLQLLRCYAAKRGIVAVQAVAEALPFADGLFDRGLCVTTICFVDDPGAMLREARRVLKPGGVLVIGFIDRTSDLGQHYLFRSCRPGSICMNTSIPSAGYC